MKLFALTALVASLALTGCATSSLLDAPAPSQTKSQSTTKTTLINDRVVAFGKPAPNAGISQSSIVIVGEEKSYVLTSGGYELTNLITGLNPNNFSVDNNLEFVSANDGKFSGVMKLSYVALKDTISRNDLQKLIQNGARECSSESDSKMNAQRFCFNLNIQGAIYPRVSNFDLVKTSFTPLTRPYQVSIYQNTVTQNTHTTHGKTTADKLVLLPFALAFDVVTLPVQILGALAE